MKVVKDYVTVQTELQKRGLWEFFSNIKQHNRMLTRDLEVFYGQFDYPEMQKNFLVWFRYDEAERAAYEHLVQVVAENGKDAEGLWEIEKFLAAQRYSKQQGDSPTNTRPTSDEGRPLYVLKDKQGRLASVHVPWIAQKHGVKRIVLFIASKSLARRARAPGQKIVLLQPAEVQWVIDQPKYQDTPKKWLALVIEKNGQPYCVVLGQDENAHEPPREPEQLTHGKHQLPGMFNACWGSGKSFPWRWN
jgi:hypothetical protein